MTNKIPKYEIVLAVPILSGQRKFDEGVFQLVTYKVWLLAFNSIGGTGHGD